MDSLSAEALWYSRREQRPMPDRDVLIILPTYNEHDTIGEL